MAARNAGQYSIRNATRKDAEDILRLANGLSESEVVKGSQECTMQLTAKDLAEDISTWYHCLLLDYRASDDALSEAVGYALWVYDYDTFNGRMAKLADLFVSAEHRGHGGGMSLMQHLAKICRDEGCKALGWTVYDWNDAAKQMYTKINAVNITDKHDMHIWYLHEKDFISLAQETSKIGLV